MSTLHRIDGHEVLYSKGAPRELVGLCVRARVEGADRPLETPCGHASPRPTTT